MVALDRIAKWQILRSTGHKYSQNADDRQLNIIVIGLFGTQLMPGRLVYQQLLMPNQNIHYGEQTVKDSV